jgi:peptidoglycan/xylan/chitin deacetylase (PgdA/CDA1 family)
MTIRWQDIGVMLFYYLGYSRIRNFIFRLQHKRFTRIVAFHDIKPEAIECFEKKLQFLKRYTNVVALDDYFSGRLSHEKVNVVITFDDGFKSWISYAVPLLKKNNLPATFFISSGFVGLTKEDEIDFIKSKLLLDRDDTENSTGGLNSREVKSMVDDGFDVGGHTLNHSNLKNLREREKVISEVFEDKQILEKITGKQIKYFSYPLGVHVNPDVDLVRILKDAGYHGAVTTVPGSNAGNTNRYFLHRELTDASMPEGVFKARVYGNYDAVFFLKKFIR